MVESSVLVLRLNIIRAAELRLPLEVVFLFFSSCPAPLLVNVYAAFFMMDFSVFSNGIFSLAIGLAR